MDKINCIVVDDEPMAREILALYIEKTPQIHLIKTCKDVAEAIKITSKEHVDLIFLDINLPEISGLTFAKIIDKSIKIIFTTAYREYAVDGFDIKAVDYLLKPFSFERFEQAIQHYNSTTENNKHLNSKATSLNYMFVRSERMMVKLDFKDINYMESYSDYIKIHLNNKTLVIRETISTMEHRLDTKNFVRIHRSYIVALDKITAYTNEFVTITDKTLPLSRTYKVGFLKRILG